MSIKVLVVDDNKLNIRLLTDILLDEDFEVCSTMNSLEVIDIAKDKLPNVILLDLMMPGIDGFQVCEQLKSNIETMEIPVIIVSAKTEGNDIKKALELGAFDYIKKPIDETEVIARIQSALRFKENQDKLKEMAMKDSLTGVYNHALLIELLEKEIAVHERIENGLAFVMLDIDFFKKVNDNYGHQSGDTILKKLAEIIDKSLRRGDILGRYGGEEFGIVLPIDDEINALSICERIRSLVENYEFNTEKGVIHITVSMGLCYKGYDENLNSSEIIKRADTALYKAKANGRNRVEIYS